MAKGKMKPAAKLILLVLIMGGIFGVVYYLTGGQVGSDTNLPSAGGKEVVKKKKKSRRSKGDVLNVAVVTWPGYAGGQYFNKGFNSSDASMYTVDYGLEVNFKVMDNVAASRAAFLNGDIDILWATVDALPTEFSEGGTMAASQPKIFMQSDWSRGGDAVVAKRTIKTVADLKGKTIAVAEMTPSHSFLIWLLSAGGLTMEDVEIKKVEDAVDAANVFKSGAVDAAVVWSPDDADCIDAVPGSRILESTEHAEFIIADVFIATQETINDKGPLIQNFVEGFMKGAAEINNDALAKKEATIILSKGLKLPVEFFENTIDKVRLCTYGDNMNFFGLDRTYRGVKGEDLYRKMSNIYSRLGYSENPLSWREIVYPDFIQNLALTGAIHEAEKPRTFTVATAETKKKAAFSSKQVTLTFDTGKYFLTEDAKYVIDTEFADEAKMFSNTRIRVEGNSDNVGNKAFNISLSKKRAKAAADYLVNTHGINRNRIIVIGNGPSNPVASNSTAAGKAQNRRTDFKLVAE